MSDAAWLQGLKEHMEKESNKLIPGSITLRYLERLGDVCQLLHTAKKLTERGLKVYIECNPRYADILKAATFVGYSMPYAPEPTERIINFGIYAKGGGSEARYHAYRRSGMTWQQFVIDGCDETRGTGGPPPFDKLDWFSPDAYSLPRDGNYAIVVPGGYSQVTKTQPQAVINLAKRLYGNAPLVQLTDKPTNVPGMLYVRRLRDMPGLLAHAKHVLTINTSASIIAAGVRSSFHFIPQTGTAALDNAEFGKGIYVTP